MEIAKELRAIIASAEELKSTLQKNSENIQTKASNVTKDLTIKLSNVRDNVELLNIEYNKSLSLNATNILTLEGVYENEVKEQERAKYIELFLNTQSNKISKRYKAQQCYIGNDILFCKSVVNYFCELIHDTMAHIYDEQNENREHEIQVFQNWLENNEIVKFIQFISDEFLCPNEIYRNNMKSIIKNSWSLKMLLALDEHIIHNNNNNIEIDDDINNNNDKQYNKNMINCLNKRSDLFKYIFGTNYILKGCHIVEIVINKLNNFNDNVLVVETGRSNVNMINKLKRHLWTSIIDVYNNFINDFKDTFWKSIIFQETFDMINNSPYKSFQFPTSTINKNDHSNNNSNNNIGENKKNGRNNSTTRNSMKSNKNDLDYVNKQHQRLKQIHAKMNVTNAGNNSNFNTINTNNNDSSGVTNNDEDLIETLRALKRIEMEKNILLNNTANNNSKRKRNYNNKTSFKNSKDFDVISYIPSCIILVESGKEILKLIYAFVNNNIDSIMLLKVVNETISSKNDRNKRIILSSSSPPPPLSNELTEDRVSMIETLLKSWFQTVSYCLDALCSYLTGIGHDGSTTASGGEQQKPSQHVEVSKRLEVIFSVKWVVERMVEMEQMVNKYKSFIYNGQHRNTISVTNVLKECENRFFHNTINSLTIEIVRELCEYHLVLDVFTYSTMPDAEFVAINSNHDNNVHGTSSDNDNNKSNKMDNKTFKEQVIDQGKYDRATPSGLMIASLEWLKYVKKIILNVFPKGSGNNAGQNILHNVLLQTFQSMLEHPSWEHLNVASIGSESELNSIQERLLLDSHVLLYSMIYDEDIDDGVATNHGGDNMMKDSMKDKNSMNNNINSAAINAANKLFRKCKNLNLNQTYFWENNDPKWFQKLPNYYEAVDCDEL